MFRLVTFGGPRLEADGTTAAPHLRRSWLAALAVLATAGERGMERDRLASLFWAESDEEHARQSARQALYSLRHELGREVVRSVGTRLSLEPAAIVSDVAEFRAAIADGDRERAVALSSLPFLDAFFLPGAPAFERWVEEERARLSVMRTTTLEALATEATRAERVDDAVRWWRELTEADPLSGRHAVGYLRALAARGDRAAALAFARRHEAMIRRELETDPDPDVRRLEAALRAMTVDVSPEEVTPARPATAIVSADAAGPTAADSRAVAGPGTAAGRAWSRRQVAVAGIATALVLVAAAALVRQREGFARAGAPPVLAVGLVQDVAAPDSAHIGRVLTDMLATNLARVEGLRVLANSRLLELVQPAADSAAAYADAARRGGATELLEGSLLPRPDGLALELRRVDLRSGVVREVVTVAAADRFDLVDSITAAMARRFGLPAPASPVAAATTRSLVAYRFYEEGLRAYYQDDVMSARRLMRAALVEDSTFAMAAFHEALLARSVGDRTPDGRHAAIARRTALRLARHAPERERLLITASVLTDDYEPGAVAVAESLALRYPEDPRSHLALARVRHTTGDWADAVAALERAIALDSAAGESEGACRTCEHLTQLADTYLWSDSLEAAIRTSVRQLVINANGRSPLYLLAIAEARRGDSAAAYGWFRRLLLNGTTDRASKLMLDLRLERYAEFERGLPELLGSTSGGEETTARWFYLIALRSEGRLRDAERVNRTGQVPGPRPLLFGAAPDGFNEAILALARGDARAAARRFEDAPPPDTLMWSRGHVARHRAWFGTLAGMAWAAAGDTARVRVLADSVARWGSLSLYGRDRRAHHYLRGLLEVAAKRDEAAVTEFLAAIHSPSLGFTRVNLELARALLRLGRPRDAAAALQPALRGELDASNLYVTRTELHELLAEAFDRAGERDSAAFHYRAVERAWRRADPEYRSRRDRAARRAAELAGVAEATPVR